MLCNCQHGEDSSSGGCVGEDFGGGCREPGCGVGAFKETAGNREEAAETCHTTQWWKLLQAAFETQFATISYRQCKTEVQTSYSTRMEIQCMSGYISKCKPAYKTGYRKFCFCTTVEDTKCSTTVEATHKTVYEKQYSTVCHGAGYGKQ